MQVYFLILILNFQTVVESWSRRWQVPCYQSNEQCIKKRLFAGHRYDRLSRPVRNDLTSTILVVGISLYYVLDTVRINSASPVRRHFKSCRTIILTTRRYYAGRVQRKA